MNFVLICCRAECQILRADARALHIITEIRGHKHYYNPWSMFRWSVAWQKVSDLSLMSGRENKKNMLKHDDEIQQGATRKTTKPKKDKKLLRKITFRFAFRRSWRGPILTWPDPGGALRRGRRYNLACRPSPRGGFLRCPAPGRDQSVRRRGSAADGGKSKNSRQACRRVDRAVGRSVGATLGML